MVSTAASPIGEAGPLPDCQPEYMLEALDHLERIHGGAPALLARHGFGEGDLERLRELLTAPSTARATG